jgi:hypothetical protein
LCRRGIERCMLLMKDKNLILVKKDKAVLDCAILFLL